MRIFVENFNDYSFLNKENEFDGFDGQGDNICPSLNWDNYPKETKSFALTMYDPDAPTGSGFWHWVAYDIPLNVCKLERNANFTGSEIKEAISDFGLAGYNGPCPPKGDVAHRYIFKVHALNCDSLNIEPSSPNSIIRFLINASTIDTASITLLYKR